MNDKAIWGMNNRVTVYENPNISVALKRISRRRGQIPGVDSEPASEAPDRAADNDA